MPLPHEFLELSAVIGSNPLLVQGPGGNTSVKQTGIMWIKASGTWLSEAMTTDIFVPVDPAKAIAEIDGAGDGTCRSAVIDSGISLRPSIETSFHAIFPQKYVFHYHSVSSICHSISIEGRLELVDKLDGLNWSRVGYCKPGIQLADSIRESFDSGLPDIVILENHGVIVAGETIDEITGFCSEIEARLELPVRDLKKSTRASIRIEGWDAVNEYSALAADCATRARATAGSYYPDHVVFLGPALPIMEMPRSSEGFGAESPVVISDSGIYVRRSATTAQSSMLRCLYDVLTRIPEEWNLVPLAHSSEAELLNWNAEKYRQNLKLSNKDNAAFLGD